MTAPRLSGRLAASALLVAGLIGLAGCAADPLAEQYLAGDNKGFIAADGLQTVEIAVGERTDPIVFSGTSDTGTTLTSEDFAGQVLVVNFWYAACGPCIVEAPELEAAYQAVAGEEVSFLGINTSDSAATARSFAADNGVSYPSLIAAGDAELKLAFTAATPLNATPVTLVIDREGRVAARIIGSLADSSILTTLVRDTLAES
ncbi:TlpA disulfide reductase family protein [Microbacterium sediminicola]|uniref:TlpA disulfide reductase family protein n=1 Tax=Microbacterium sediminicola TaxID=415210 RepID=A0ABN2I7K0_9MICO